MFKYSDKLQLLPSGGHGPQWYKQEKIKKFKNHSGEPWRESMKFSEQELKKKGGGSWKFRITGGLAQSCIQHSVQYVCRKI